MSNRRIACWMSEKKTQKINWTEFEDVCKCHGFEVFKLDLNKSIESQGPFSILLHKLTDIIASANQGDVRSSNIINTVESYVAKHPNLIVIDPIMNVRQLLDRYKCYSIIQSTDLHNYGVFTPNFCEITTNNRTKTAQQLKFAKVEYPFICKPQLGHGSKKAHEMLIVFNENNLKDCRAPCVAQSFINHNAVLYKIFIVGDRYFFVERPSLRNFYACDDKAIFFDSSDVSKAGSQSKLSVLDPEDEDLPKNIPNPDILERIARTLRKAFGMDLLGVDVVIENSTQKYAIIDVNAYPGYIYYPNNYHELGKGKISKGDQTGTASYDGFPNLYEALIECIKDKLNNANHYQLNGVKEDCLGSYNCINTKSADLNVYL